MSTFVTRYVITKIDRNGFRVVATPRQGRFTFGSMEDCEAAIAAINDGDSKNRGCHNTSLEARSCRCWPNHFDPVDMYFPS